MRIEVLTCWGIGGTIQPTPTGHFIEEDFANLNSYLLHRTKRCCQVKILSLPSDLQQAGWRGYDLTWEDAKILYGEILYIRIDKIKEESCPKPIP